MATNNAINLKAAGIPTYDGAGTFTASTTTLHSILLGGASNAITNLGVATDGQIPIGSSGADPVLAVITGSGGITITNGAGSIDVSASGGGLSWVVVSGTTQAMAVDTGYISNNAGAVTLTLPATAAVGSTNVISGLGAGGWVLAQNASQLVHLGSSVTTTGTGGSLASTNAFDSVTIVCAVANTTWLVMDVVGNLTVV